MHSHMHDWMKSPDFQHPPVVIGKPNFSCLVRILVQCHSPNMVDVYHKNMTNLSTSFGNGTMKMFP